MPVSDVDSEEFLLNELSRINSDLVTRQRAAHRETADVEASREREKRYVSMVAHDLNNPLQVILGYTQVLLNDPDLAPAQRNVLERIDRSGQLMRSLVADLSDGFDANADSEIERRPVHFADLVESVVGRHQILSSDKSLTLELTRTLPVGERCMVAGDVVKLERVLNNLLGNAVKYSPAGTAIVVTFAVEDGVVAVTVNDEGPGISAEGRELIFEMFHRESATAHLPGVGLGLFISRRIAEQHGGTITVDEAPGGGAAFVLTLPLASDPDEPHVTAGED
jgi:signal transduction histidine kinase